MYLKVFFIHFYFLSLSLSWIVIFCFNIFLFIIITDNYQSIASDLCTFAKSQGSRDNISVIVVYLKDPHLIATQTWPSAIQQNITTASTSSSSTIIMDNLYDQMPNEVASPNSATMDVLGNTNQVSILKIYFIKNHSLNCLSYFLRCFFYIFIQLKSISTANKKTRNHFSYTILCKLEDRISISRAINKHAAQCDIILMHNIICYVLNITK